MKKNESSSLRTGDEVKKAIIPIAGLGTRFLPLSKVVPKELWPLVDKPVIQYIIEEARESGISEIVFVVSPKKKIVLDYFAKSSELEKILKKRKNAFLNELKDLTAISRDISFSSVTQKNPLGDGHAILQAKDKVKDENTAVLFADDVVDSKTPCLLQLLKVFKTCKKPVVGLYRLPKEKLSSYGIVGVEKIANRFYKLKKIVEKPQAEEAPSDLAIIGKYVLTPEVFKYLKKVKPTKKGEIILAEALTEMLKDGKVIYGYEIEGKWLECGNKPGWLESHTYLSLKHPQLGKHLKNI